MKDMPKKRVALFASGGGSNAQALLDAMKEPSFPAEPVLLFSNKPDAYALERGKLAGVMTLYLDPKGYATREDFDQALVNMLGELKVDLICFAGYMRIVTPVLVQAFPGRILNVHPALLPKFGGTGMYGHHVHEAVLKAGEAESGASVHLVTEGVDEGEILLQGKVPVLPGDTAETLSKRVLEQEHLIYPQALRILIEKIA
jgi:phosphoribosylglycinamide formyltransferase-1